MVYRYDKVRESVPIEISWIDGILSALTARAVTCEKCEKVNASFEEFCCEFFVRKSYGKRRIARPRIQREVLEHNGMLRVI